MTKVWTDKPIDFTGPVNILGKEKIVLDFFRLVFPNLLYSNIAQQTDAYFCQTRQNVCLSNSCQHRDFGDYMHISATQPHVFDKR